MRTGGQEGESVLTRAVESVKRFLPGRICLECSVFVCLSGEGRMDCGRLVVVWYPFRVFWVNGTNVRRVVLVARFPSGVVRND